MQGSRWRELSSQAEAEDPLDAGAVHPARRPRVPRPAAAPHVRRHGVDVGGGDVGLDLVAMDARARAGVVDRVQDAEQLARLVAVAERREGQHRPDRRVRVLSAVLTDARQVSLDVAGIEGRLVERRGEEQDEPVAALNEVLLDGGHGPGGALGHGRARDHAPRLRDRIDAALDVLGRAERRAVVEVRSPVPVAVPRVPLERHLQRGHVMPPRLRAA